MLFPLLGLLFSLGGCRNDRVAVNPKDLNSPQFAYRLDELALLQMNADDVQELERKKQYGKLYDQYASDAFKQGVTRRRFLIMSNCVESFLGDLQEYDRNDVGFHREQLKEKGQQYGFIDVLNRKVQRSLGSIEEQLVFAPLGLNFKLNGLYWISKDKQFLQCIAESPQIEAQTTPQPEGAPAAAENAKPTEGEPAQKTEEAPPTQGKSEAQPSAETLPAKPEGEQPATPQPFNPNAPNPAAPASTPPAVPVPVQGMKPAEIRKEPLGARPAGAGAVVDQRPLPVKTPAEIKAEEDAKKRRQELEKLQTVPLPTTGGSDD